jgi:septal ring factor EnvC (AmiA/AmiB activator)
VTKAPHDLTATILREIRGDLGHLRERADETTAELKALRKQIHDWQETTATATGFAMHANIRGQAFEEQLAELRKRVEKLEKTR